MAALSVTTAYGAIIVVEGTDGGGTGDWNDTGNFWQTGANFTSTNDGFSTITGGGFGAPHAGAATISVPSTVGLPTPVPDKVYGSGDLSGTTDVDWGDDGVRGITFDFYVPSGRPAPAALNLYFRGGGYFWLTTLTPPAAGSGWNEGFAANVGYGYGWTQILAGGSSQSTWNDAYEHVDEVGLLVSWNVDEAAIDYGVDNFALHNDLVIRGVPEPGSCAALAAALLSLTITFRKKLTGAPSDDTA
jgi:hypothetical protein